MEDSTSDWQLRCTTLNDRGFHLLQSGQWSDCSFLVGLEVVPAHKLTLAMASPAFAAMFFGVLAERNEPIPIKDIQLEAFKALLEYIYTDKINISSVDIACELYYGAKKYFLQHLEKGCMKYIYSVLQPNNACRVYEFARFYDENIMMDKCLQIIRRNTKEVLTANSFNNVGLSTMVTVFSLPHLKIDSELDLFEAVVRYARAQAPASPRPASPEDDEREKVVVLSDSACAGAVARREPEPGPSEPSRQDNELTIRSAINKIRFLTLTAQQFAAGPAGSSLLTQSEALAVLMNILDRSTDAPLPSGFSNSRVPRIKQVQSPSDISERRKRSQISD